MPSGKAIVVVSAALIVVVGGGAAAAYVASSGDEGDGAPLAQAQPAPADHQSPPDPSEAVDEVPLAPEEPKLAQPQPEQEPQAPAAPAPEQQESNAGATSKTHFPRERKQDRNDDAPQKEFTVPPAREFSGEGNASLGTVDVSQSAVVKWSTKGSFELRFGREDFPIIAPSPSGRLVIPAYRFEFVRVIASGPWKIRIAPQR